MNRIEASPPRLRSGRRSRSQRGTALIEFALVFPLLLVLTFTVIDLGRAFMIKNVLHTAAREGARVLVVSMTTDAADARVRQVMTAAKVPVTTISYMGVPVGQPGQGQQGVSVSTSFSWLFLGLFNNILGAGFSNPVTLTAQAWMYKETP
jgi:Flp pilus assembly protein TadG